MSERRRHASLNRRDSDSDILVWSRSSSRLRSEAKLSGRILPDADFWIAALALQHRLRLVTMDEHFELLPELRPALIRISERTN